MGLSWSIIEPQPDPQTIAIFGVLGPHLSLRNSADSEIRSISGSLEGRVSLIGESGFR